jgi:hypothetical protein
MKAMASSPDPTVARLTNSRKRQLLAGLDWSGLVRSLEFVEMTVSFRLVPANVRLACQSHYGSYGAVIPCPMINRRFLTPSVSHGTICLDEMPRAGVFYELVLFGLGFGFGILV